TCRPRRCRRSEHDRADAGARSRLCAARSLPSPPHGFVDHRYKLDIGIWPAETGRRLAHLREPTAVLEQRHDNLLEREGVEIGVLDEEAAAGTYHRSRVEPLLTVADGQRYI